MSKAVFGLSGVSVIVGALLCVACSERQPAPSPPTPTAEAPAVAPAQAAPPAVDTVNARRFVQGDGMLEVLDFDRAGVRTVQGAVLGDVASVYAVPVAAGQTLTVTFTPSNANLYINVSDAADLSGAALHRGLSETQNGFSASLIHWWEIYSRLNSVRFPSLSADARRAGAHRRRGGRPVRTPPGFSDRCQHLRSRLHWLRFGAERRGVDRRPSLAGHWSGAADARSACPHWFGLPPEERGKAFGVWVSAGTLFGMVGPLVGGWLSGHADWRFIFWINVPLAALTMVVALRALPESRNNDARGLDWLGALLVMTGLAAVTWSLISAPDRGWDDPAIIIGLVCGGGALAAFLLVEARERYPMTPLALFRSPVFSGTNGLTLLLYFALGGAMFFLPFDLIRVQGFSATMAGAAMLAPSIQSN